MPTIRFRRFPLGVVIFATDDPRHLGEVIRNNSNYWYLIRWRDTGWISELTADEIERAYDE